jgi:signal transduction histidine kinase
LNFISGSLNALNTLKEKYISHETNLSAEKKELLRLIEQVMGTAFDGIERASNVISKLDFFAHPKTKQDRKEISVEKLMQSALGSIESRLPYYIRLTTEIDQDIKVLCHEQQLKMVFTYILRNAIDALESKERGEREKIDISAARVSHHRKPYTRISFCNSGPAIPEEDIKHIFDPFFSSKETGEGIGLGMSLSYMIIREHGGKLEVKNQDGIVRFDIFLPAWTERVSDGINPAF